MRKRNQKAVQGRSKRAKEICRKRLVPSKLLQKCVQFKRMSRQKTNLRNHAPYDKAGVIDKAFWDLTRYKVKQEAS